MKFLPSNTANTDALAVIYPRPETPTLTTIDESLFQKFKVAN